MQQQQAPQTMNAVPSPPLHLVTTEQIQKYLDENKNLILAIMENQNLGKMAECAQYQAVLQKNLMYLAAIADAQPPTSQAATGPQGISPMLHTQTPMMVQQQQAGKMPFQFNALRPQEQQQQHYQLLQLQQHQQQLQASQFGMGGPTNDGSHYVLMQPGLGGSGSRVSQQGAGNSGLGNTEGKE